MLEIDLIRLLDRAGPLVFGVLGSVGTSDEMTTIGAGSGVFVAPQLALTARHVSHALFELEPGGDPGFLPEPRRTKHAVGLFQVLDPRNANSDRAFWHVDQSWSFIFSDLCLMEVSPEDGVSHAMALRWPRRPFELQLLPPEPGSVVQALGFPKHEVTNLSQQIAIGAPVTFIEGIVREIYSPYRERGLINFPAFTIEVPRRIDHGFSGGPVFCDGKLCGIISAAPDFDQTAYVAALWPLLRDERISRRLARYELFAAGWERLAEQVVVRTDDRGEYLDLVAT